MYTVADHAGVSIATVSRVLGGRGAVGYRLNGAARALATRRQRAPEELAATMGIDAVVVEPAEPVTLPSELVLPGSCDRSPGQRPTA